MVLNADTGEPVRGAQVAVGHHLGEGDVKRIREEGVEGDLQVNTKTDEQGRFALRGVAFWDYHLFSVKRDGFVPHEEWIALRKDQPEAEVQVNLKPAATITVKVVDGEGMPMLGEVVRIESVDGHALLPARGDWRPELSYRTETAKMGMCSFKGLPAGVYWVDAMRTGLSETVYHGRWISREPGSKYITYLPLKAGETKEIEIKPADHRSAVKVRIEKDPHVVSKWAALLVISRHPGLLAWAGKTFYHLEDARLARVIQYTLNSVTADSPNDFRWGAIVFSDTPYTFRSFPPGTYAILTITWGKYKFEDRQYEAAYMRGARVEINAGKEVVVEIPWVEPEGPSPLNPRTFSNRVDLEAKEYSAQDVCDLLNKTITERIGAEARIAVDSSIRSQKVAFGAGTVSLWDLLERTYLETGWRLEPDYKAKMMILRPSAPSPR